MIALYRYAEAEYRVAYDAVISSLLKVIVGK